VHRVARTARWSAGLGGGTLSPASHMSNARLRVLVEETAQQRGAGAEHADDDDRRADASRTSGCSRSVETCNRFDNEPTHPWHRDRPQVVELRSSANDAARRDRGGSRRGRSRRVRCRAASSNASGSKAVIGGDVDHRAAARRRLAWSSSAAATSSMLITRRSPA
jgi:hypothetical protein